MEFGVAKRSELSGTIGAAALRAALSNGTLKVVGRGWVAESDADPRIVRALEHGARLTCLSSLNLRGLWVPERHTVCWSINRRHSDKLPSDVVAHGVRRWVDESPIMSADASIRQVLLHHDSETALIVLESAIEHELLTLHRARSLAEAASQRSQRVLQFLTAGAQSGTETRVRMFLQQHQVLVRAQVQIDGVGRVDLIVGQSLVIECDSRAHHTGAEAEARDLERDLALARLGYTVVRLTYEQVFLDWEATQRLLLDLVQNRKHRRPIRKSAI